MNLKMKDCSELVRRWADYPSKEKIESLRLFRCKAVDYSKEDLICFIIYQSNKAEETRKENAMHRGDLIFGKERNPLRR